MVTFKEGPCVHMGLTYLSVWQKVFVQSLHVLIFWLQRSSAFFGWKHYCNIWTKQSLNSGDYLEFPAIPRIAIPEIASFVEMMINRTTSASNWYRVVRRFCSRSYWRAFLSVLMLFRHYQVMVTPPGSSLRQRTLLPRKRGWAMPPCRWSSRKCSSRSVELRAFVTC